MRDSYKTFFEYFKIDFSEIIKFGVDIDTIYPDPKLIYDRWKSLVNSIEENKEVYIRGYGRDAHGTHLYQELYKILLNNDRVKKDPTNNAKPRQILQQITGFSKTVRGDSERKIQNYQVTHIFGRTKNPFLFSAPWNIVWKSKILDPFTGHEARGPESNAYKNAFQKKCREYFSQYITEYNVLAEKYFSEEKIEKAFYEMKLKLSVDEKVFERFKLDASEELKKI
jgi:hypothetical protein